MKWHLMVSYLKEKTVTEQSDLDCGPDATLTFHRGKMTLRGPKVNLDIDDIDSFSAAEMQVLE